MTKAFSSNFLNFPLNQILSLTVSTMFSIARNAVRARSALARSLVAPSYAASIHTLPQLPYEYNVSLPIRVYHKNRLSDCHPGPRALHLGGDHETSSPEASSDLRQWTQCGRGVVLQVELYQGANCVAVCLEVQRRRSVHP